MGEFNEKLKKIPVVGFFAEKSFFHYLWSGGLFTVLSIFFIWFFIDIMHFPTIIGSSISVGGIFILRYILFRFLKIM